ncbi:MAG: sterol desaturase family protein [Maritimibacter sp.]
MNDLTFPDVTSLGIPVFVAAILIEILYIRLSGRGGRYELRDAMTSLFMGVGGVVIGLLLGFMSYGLMMLLWQVTPFDLGVGPLALLACFVLDDLRFYVKHRLEHRVRWGWASHVNHHSSQHFNLTTALRQTWTADVSLLWLVTAPLVLMGFHPGLVLFVGGINLLYQFWIHTEAIERMPRWFEAVMNTPSHHRVHHARNPRYLDANYAGVFILWDRIFGTFVAERDDDPVDYGLVHNIGTFNPIRVALHEWAAMLRDMRAPGTTWRDRMTIALRPPGWSREGGDGTARIKAAYVAKHPDVAGTAGFEQVD